MEEGLVPFLPFMTEISALRNTQQLPAHLQHRTTVHGIANDIPSCAAAPQSGCKPHVTLHRDGSLEGTPRGVQAARLASSQMAMEPFLDEVVTNLDTET